MTNHRPRSQNTANASLEKSSKNYKPLASWASWSQRHTNYKKHKIQNWSPKIYHACVPLNSCADNVLFCNTVQATVAFLSTNCTLLFCDQSQIREHTIFLQVSGHNLDSSKTWGFCVDFVNQRKGDMVFYQVFLLFSFKVYSKWTVETVRGCVSWKNI